MSPTVTTMKIVSRAARISTASRANSYPVTPKRNSRSRCLTGPAPHVISAHPHPCTVRLDPSGGHRGPMAISLSAAGTAAAILLVLIVMLWFTWGTQRNISRGNELLRWLQAGLPVLGRRATVKWLGSSAVELGIVEPAPPFAEASVVVVLEPRDVPWFWAWARRRGRRDFLILRARLERHPGLELEAGDETGWTGGDRTAALDEGSWARAERDRPGLRVFHAPGSDPAQVLAFL